MINTAHTFSDAVRLFAGYRAGLAVLPADSEPTRYLVNEFALVSASWRGRRWALRLAAGKASL